MEPIWAESGSDALRDYQYEQVIIASIITIYGHNYHIWTWRDYQYEQAACGAMDMVVSHFRHAVAGSTPVGNLRIEVMAYALALSGSSGGKMNRLLYNVVTSGTNQVSRACMHGTATHASPHLTPCWRGIIG